MEPIIEVNDLRVGYGDQVVLDRITFQVQPGEVFVILGGSGCGKSTLLKHLIGLNIPQAGSIRLAGLNLLAAQDGDRLAILRKIGVMYQSGALFGSMTLLENAKLPLEEHTRLPKAAIDRVARMKLGLVGLEAFVHYRPDQISGGMRKRAAIARAMALDPEILFLDEPSAGLDPITSAELDDLILNLARNLGMTFVIVTHELPSIFAVADRVIMLDRETKGIVAEGRPRELQAESPNPWVQRFFNRQAAENGTLP